MYRVNCEWDIGLADVVFHSGSGAWAAAIEALRDCGIDDSPDDLERQGLLSLESLEVRP